jgi:hypothetical protein
MAASGAPGGPAVATTYNDDSILQALRRLQPDDLIKHMLETEEWSERLTKQCGAQLRFGARSRCIPSCLTDGVCSVAQVRSFPGLPGSTSSCLRKTEGRSS